LKIIVFLLFLFLVKIDQSLATGENDFSCFEKKENFLQAKNIKAYTAGDSKIITQDFIFPLRFDEENKLQALKQEIEKGEVKNKDSDKSKSGFKYVVKKGENIWLISKKFKVPVKDILAYNGLNEKAKIKAGDKIFIPGVTAQASLKISSASNFKGKFVSALTQVGGLLVPVSGLNWGNKHGQNGTDIAASCGQEVFATKGGTVVESQDGWNGGYGSYIIIHHGGGVYSLYGHLSLRLVEVGEKVSQGQLIGYVGNTGYTVGETGCHLHFEIRGRSNPLLQ